MSASHNAVSRDLKVDHPPIHLMTAHPCCHTPGPKLKTWSIWVRGGLLVNQGPSMTGRIWFATVIEIPACLVRVCQLISLPGKPRQGLHRPGARMKAETSKLGMFAATMDRDSFEGRVSCPGSENPSHQTDILPYCTVILFAGLIESWHHR